MLERYMAVSHARTHDELKSEIERITQQLGFQTMSATVVVDDPEKRFDPQFYTVGEAPAAYQTAFDSRDNWRRDPVMQHCKHMSVPIIWNQDTYTAAGEGELWEEQAPFGYREGIAMALHLPQGRHFMFGVECDHHVPTDPAELTRIVADLQLLTVHALDTASRILVPAPAPAAPPPASIAMPLVTLTPRELEALHWTMEGKTAWEVGSILGISERTAVLHVNNAMHKLGCTSKHQAVLKALRLGLLR